MPVVLDETLLALALQAGEPQTDISAEDADCRQIHPSVPLLLTQTYPRRRNPAAHSPHCLAKLKYH